MGSKQCVVLLLLFVAVAITEAQVPVFQPKPPVYAGFPVFHPYFQDMGRFAVGEYNKLGKSYLYFKEVYGGYLYIQSPVYYTYITYYLDLKASNCSQFETLANYTAVVEVLNSGKQTFISLTLKN